MPPINGILVCVVIATTNGQWDFPFQGNLLMLSKENYSGLFVEDFIDEMTWRPK